MYKRQEIKRLCEAFRGEMLTSLADGIDELEDVKELVFRALNDELPISLKDGGVIRPGYNKEVDELRDIMHGGKGYLAQMCIRDRCWPLLNSACRTAV